MYFIIACIYFFTFSPSSNPPYSLWLYFLSLSYVGKFINQPCEPLCWHVGVWIISPEYSKHGGWNYAGDLRVGGLAYKSKLGREDPKKVKHDLDSLYALCGESHCAVSSSFVCSADFLMRGFWRRMTERSACSVGEEGHLKEMSNALSMDTPNTRFPPCSDALLAAWQHY